ncbi:hypothetical protein VHA01S_038_00400 [Vibrio halioticoli NBRC 102217]|uniref:Fimbrial-type adhesion domain-containing protein n=1 Tax=Vibrio halioticoli NBRC 102217 TaxID=1219072 RepID=V5FN60_9VIBR|nr:hypothetical protein [Vibrio halioticoli]GAD90272.1 hypothetical protein VHA01S_038_00400 [Vibrio halioticoli NBRC 102217]
MKNKLVSLSVLMLFSFGAAAAKSSSYVIFNGSVSPMCGWEGQGIQSGVLGYDEEYTDVPAIAILVNNAGENNATLEYTSDTGILNAKGHLRIKLIPEHGPEYPEQNHNGTFENVQAGELKFYANMKMPKHHYPAGQHTVRSTFTVTCE